MFEEGVLDEEWLTDGFAVDGEDEGAPEELCETEDSSDTGALDSVIEESSMAEKFRDESFEDEFLLVQANKERAKRAIKNSAKIFFMGFISLKKVCLVRDTPKK